MGHGDEITNEDCGLDHDLNCCDDRSNQSDEPSSSSVFSTAAVTTANEIVDDAGRAPKINVKRRVSYGPVTVYYFIRSQGFSCVPTFGGNTLGMSRKHHACRLLTLNDHQDEIRQYREVFLDEQQQTPSPIHLSIPRSLTSSFFYQNPPLQQEDYANEFEFGEESFEEDVDEEDEEEEEDNNEDCDDPNTHSFPVDTCEEVLYRNGSEDINKIMNISANDVQEFEMPEDYFVQPIDNKHRRMLLKGVGVELDQSERTECQMIRVSRQNCGCSCQNGQCLPETCSCALDNIKCQVDRPTFPCACSSSSSSCQNTFGRVEFNANRVRSHYLTTMMRLRLTDKLNDQQRSSPVHTRFDIDYDSSYVEQPAALHYTNNNRTFHATSLHCHAEATSSTASLVYNGQTNDTTFNNSLHCNEMVRNSAVYSSDIETYSNNEMYSDVTSQPPRKKLKFDVEAKSRDFPIDDDEPNETFQQNLISKSDSNPYSLTTLYTKRQRTSMGLRAGDESNAYFRTFSYSDTSATHFASSNQNERQTQHQTVSSSDSDYDSASASPTTECCSTGGANVASEQTEKQVCVGGTSLMKIL